MRVGLDVGGTKTDAVAVTEAGEVAARVRLATGWGPDAVVQTILDAVAALAADPAAGPVDSIGIGMPGQVAADGTRVLHAVNLGVEELDLASALAPGLRTGQGLETGRVRIENDVKAAALGAYALRGMPGSMAYLNLGTGVAAGFVFDGALWRGARGTAGEVGHISVDPGGPLCRCGQRGCIEAFAGGAAIAARWARPGALAVPDVFDAAEAGDPDAAALRAGLARGVAAAVRVLVLTADVDVVVLGGGLTGLGERLVGDVRRTLQTSASASAFLRSLHLDERVDVLPAGSPAAALGAALIGASLDAEEEVLPRG
jgi:predicted NBD/HSP70 family sugar kinase